MVPVNIFDRTFRIRTNTSEGTCFTVEVDNCQYIITARHLVEKIVDQSTVQIMQDGQWKNLRVKLVGHGKGDVDISVLTAEYMISPTVSLSVSLDGILLGQDVYFFGFPYGLANDFGGLNRKLPAALVKKAIVSLIAKGGNPILLDGHNNPGFSGGPVVFDRKIHRDPSGKPILNLKSSDNAWSVAGVVAGYRHAREPVYQNEEQEQNRSPIGYYKSNTGIIVAYAINNALELIHQNPIGTKLRTGKIQN